MRTYQRLVTMVLRPTTPPVAWGIGLACVLIAVEILVISMLKKIAPENAFGAVFLFGVLVVSAGWGFRLAIATSIASAAAYGYIHVLESSESLVPSVLVFLALALLANVLVGQSRVRAIESEALHARTIALARQQASLRRVATLVALRAEPADVFAAVARELADGLDIEHVSVVRYDKDGHYTVLAVRDDAAGGHPLAAGEHLPLGGYNVCSLVAATGEPAQIDFTAATGPIVDRLDGRGFHAGAGVPITVDRTAWGAVIIGATSCTSSGPETANDELLARMTDFADLVATAVHNDETRLELTRSRARVVAAADQARRAIERDLHDGAQQRIVSLGMELRTAQAAVPIELDDLRDSLDRSVDTLSQVHNDLRELSRGIHPAILSRGGLAPALKTLARRSPIPVTLSTDIPTRLPEQVEVAAYYVVAEALTNTAKYAAASYVSITAVAQADQLDMTVVDDGRGGADPNTGSGLIGLQDRIAAVGGVLDISSPPGIGTTLTVHVDLTRVAALTTG